MNIIVPSLFLHKNNQIAFLWTYDFLIWSYCF
jgi:hypothetical protein